jgi:NodT family efflux transporter outer membrane factor (OMF) lipoprotein
MLTYKWLRMIRLIVRGRLASDAASEKTINVRRPLLNPRSGTLLICFLLTGCMVGPNYRRPFAPVPMVYKEMKGWMLAMPANGYDRGAWWKIYQDPILDSLENQVNLSNQNIKQYEASYQEARATVREQQSALFPSLTVTPGVQTQKSGVASSATRYSLSNSVSWELDVWGKVRRNVESSVASAQSSAAQLADARLLAQAELATDYFNLRYQDALQQLLDDTVKVYEHSLQIVENQYKAGTAARSDVLTAQTQLLTTKAQAQNVGVQRATYEHAIAMLTGRTPAEVSVPVRSLTSRIPNVPVTVPSALLQQRPDIAEAERQMQEQNALIGVQKAAFFPAIDLSASLSYGASGLGSLLAASNQAWTLAASAGQTVFSGGQRVAALEAAHASYMASVANYRQTVLAAFQGVEDELATLRILKEQGVTEDAAVVSAQHAVDISINEYKAGTVAYTTVLTAQATLLGDQQTALSILSNRMLASVSLIRYLGGGWDISQLPSNHELQKLHPYP